MNSEIIYLYMYDTGPERIDAARLGSLLKNPEDFSKYEFTKPEPEEIATFDVPSIFNLQEETLTMEDVQHKFKVQVAIYVFGSFSIRIRYQITSGAYSQMSKFTYDPRVNKFLKDVVEKAKKRVEAAISKIQQIKVSQIRETYRFYYIEGEKSQILPKSKKMIAGLLIDEKDADTLEADYIEYILGKSIAYDEYNVLFVGWESTVMIDKGYQFEQELLIAEIASLQLLEMRIYHSILATELDSATRALRFYTDPILSISGRTDLRALNRSLGRVYDNSKAVINNINDTAFGLGEWYLSRVYSLFSNVLKLDVMKASVEKDLEAIDNERKYVSDLEMARRDTFLERIVILLILVEVILEVLFLLK